MKFLQQIIFHPLWLCVTTNGFLSTCSRANAFSSRLWREKKKKKKGRFLL